MEPLERLPLLRSRTWNVTYCKKTQFFSESSDLAVHYERFYVALTSHLNSQHLLSIRLFFCFCSQRTIRRMLLGELMYPVQSSPSHREFKKASVWALASRWHFSSEKRYSVSSRLSRIPDMISQVRIAKISIVGEGWSLPLRPSCGDQLVASSCCFCAVVVPPRDRVKLRSGVAIISAVMSRRDKRWQLKSAALSKPGAGARITSWTFVRLKSMIVRAKSLGATFSNKSRTMMENTCAHQCAKAAYSTRARVIIKVVKLGALLQIFVQLASVFQV